MTTGRNTIWLSTRNIWDKEAPLATGADITPGMLVQYDGTNAAVEVHSSAAALPKPLMVAVEATWKFSSDIDTHYDTVGEQVDFCFPLPGDLFYGLLAAGENVAVNDLVESNGDGTLQAGSSAPIGRVKEAVNNSAGYTAARVVVEVI